MAKPMVHQARWATSTEKMAQRAIVMLYLRVRRARARLRRAYTMPTGRVSYLQDSASGAYIEAQQALEMAKQVLRHGDWS